MANTKISQLPSYTGTAADLRWFVMNNSGETETFKYSGYSSPFRWDNSTSGVTQVNNTKSSTFNARGLTNNETAGSFSNFIIGKGNNTGSAGMFMFVFGDDNTTTAGGGLGTADAIVNFGRANQILGDSTHTSFVFGRGCIASAPRTFVFGEDTQAFGTDSISMGRQNYANVTESTSIGGSFNRITNSSESSIFGGKSNTISSSNTNNMILGGNNNTISGSTTNATMVGCSGRTADDSNTTYVEKMKAFRGVVELTDGTNTINPGVKSALVMGTNNTISSTLNFNYLIMGQDNTINATVGSAPFAMVFGLGSSVSAFGGVCFGGYSSVGGERAFRWGNNGSSNGTESFSWGEQVNVNGARSFGFGGYMTITPENSYSFGVGNSITTSTAYQGIFGSENNLISSTGGNNFIFGSKASTISGTSQFVSLIGLSGFTSPTEDNTTYVDNFQVINKVVLRDYTNLDYADDAAAAAGGIVLGGVYHTSGALKIRVT
jgi:hypothetical protein